MSSDACRRAQIEHEYAVLIDMGRVELYGAVQFDPVMAAKAACTHNAVVHPGGHTLSRVFVGRPSRVTSGNAPGFYYSPFTIYNSLSR